MSRDEILEQIAKKHLGLQTLETRGRDHLDFSEHSVFSLKKALEEAYNSGKGGVRDGNL